MNTFIIQEKAMNAPFNSAFDMIGKCTWRGLIYGLASGSATGAAFFLYGVIFGAPMGLLFGPLFGFINGIVLWYLDEHRGIRRNHPEDRAKRRMACLLTSVLTLTVISLVCWYVEPFALFYCLVALPGVIVSALILGNWVTAQYLLVVFCFFVLSV